MSDAGDSAAPAGRLVQVFRSARRPGMYLIVDRAEGIARVPESLLTGFGTPEPSLVFMLTPTRSMAVAEAPEVLAAIEGQGYWLQMPPMPLESDNARELREGRDDHEGRESRERRKSREGREGREGRERIEGHDDHV